MAHLRHSNATPPGGWKYFQKESRLWIEGEDLSDLIIKLTQHRSYKGFGRHNPDEVWADIEQQTCERIGPDFCKAEKGEVFHYYRDVTQNIELGQITGFTKAAITHIANGGELVGKEEAEVRAETCRGCQFNVPLKGCGGCAALYKLVDALVPADRQFHGVNLCAVCGCSLKAKINAPRNVVKASDAGRNLAYPPHCWINKL